MAEAEATLTLAEDLARRLGAVPSQRGVRPQEQWLARLRRGELARRRAVAVALVELLRRAIDRAAAATTQVASHHAEELSRCREDLAWALAEGHHATDLVAGAIAEALAGRDDVAS